MKCTDCEHFNILYDPYSGGCKHHVVFENYCKKKKESVAFTDPACDDYEMWDMEKEDGHTD